MLVLQFTFIALFNLAMLDGLYRSSRPGKMALNKFYIYVVLNLDAYRRAIKPQTELNDIKRLQVSIMLVKARKSLWKNMFPFNAALKWWYSVKISFLMAKTHQNLNVAQFRSQKLPEYFHVPLMLRIRLARTVMLIDSCCAGIQLSIGMTPT